MCVVACMYRVRAGGFGTKSDAAKEFDNRSLLESKNGVSSLD